MKKITKYIGIAAIALMGPAIMGCSENDLVENTPQDKAVTLTTTISLDGSSAATRALDADGKKTFAAGEQIALIYESAENGAQKVVISLQETNISSDKKKATLIFNLEKAPKANGNFTMIYPASMAQEPLPSTGEFGDIASPNYATLATQNGTLASLSSNLDLAYCESTFTSDATLPGGISLTNQLAILELTIKDYPGTNDLNGIITNLTVKVGSGASDPTYTVTRTAAAGPIYLAMQPCTASDITITATDGTTNYEKTVSSQSLTASTMTPVTAKMWKVVDLSQLLHDYPAKDGDVLTGTDPTYHHKISIANDARVKLKNAIINNNDSQGEYFAGLTCEGNAFLFLEGTNTITGYESRYPGIYVPEGYTLTISGSSSDKLTVRSHGSAAGIGAGNDDSNKKCGNIVIEGGDITAYGYADYENSNSGAGIGGKSSSCGDIIIKGGFVKAFGGQEAAGIGAGNGGNSQSISITGGTVEATGGRGAAGIGGGQWGQCGPITIAKTVTSVKAIKGNTEADRTDPYSIGVGSDWKSHSDGIACACGKITFDTQEFTVTGSHDGTYNSWTYSPEPANGTYGGLTLTISTTTISNDTWTLTP